MSWQNYVDQQLMGSGIVAKAIIAGHDGTLWAKSSNVNPTKDELQRISQSFTDQTDLTMSGLTVEGEKFFFLSGNDRVIRCRKAASGLHVMKTLKAILIAIFDEPIQHPQVASVVETLGDYLISVAY